MEEDDDAFVRFFSHDASLFIFFDPTAFAPPIPTPRRVDRTLDLGRGLEKDTGCDVDVVVVVVALLLLDLGRTVLTETVSFDVFVFPAVSRRWRLRRTAFAVAVLVVPEVAVAPETCPPFIASLRLFRRELDRFLTSAFRLLDVLDDEDDAVIDVTDDFFFPPKLEEPPLLAIDDGL